MSKKLIASILTFSLMGTTVFATGVPAQQQVNTNKILSEAIVQNNTTYVPLETLIALLGQVNTPAAAPTNTPATMPSTIPNNQPIAPATTLTQEQALAQILAQYGLTLKDVTNLEVDLDTDDNRKEYEIEFNAGNKEYEYEVNANTGTVLESDVDFDDDDDDDYYYNSNYYYDDDYYDDDYDDYYDDDDDDDYDDYYDDDDDDDDDDDRYDD